jgi:hypothetical protein
MAAADLATPELPFPTEPEEEWRPVVDWEGLYEVSDLGRVRTVPHLDRMGRLVPGRIRKLNLAGPPPGRLHLSLKRDRVEVGAYAHQLVMQAFVGPRPDGMEVRHGPGGPHDNRLVNLCYGTKTDNNGPDKLRDGTLRYGESHYRSRVSADNVADIRRRRAAGEPCRVLAAEYGVDEGTISVIATGGTWARVAPELIVPPYRGKLSPEDVAAIRERYAAGGVYQYELAAEYGVTQRMISLISQGRR